MPQSPEFDDRKLVNPPRRRPQDAVGSEGGASNYGSPRWTEKPRGRRPDFEAAVTLADEREPVID